MAIDPIIGLQADISEFTTVKPPVDEVGTMLPTGFGGASTAQWLSFVEDMAEQVPDWLFPQSIALATKMRRDTQVKSLLRACVWPIMRYEWKIDPNGASDECVKNVAEDLNLPVIGDENSDPSTSRASRRFSFPNFIREALLALDYGFMPMEQVCEYRGGKYRLKSLKPRMPHTIQDMLIDPQGSLIAVRQNISAGNNLNFMPAEIGIERLCMFVWEKEGANWFGTSMLRELYKPWMIKDRVLRVGAINIERGGGVPYAIAPPEASTRQMNEIQMALQAFKVGEMSGLVLPHGATLAFATGSSGSDAKEYIGMCDEQMARAFLAMFIQLGQTQTGSRNLGQQFIDYAAASQEVVATWFAEAVNFYIIEDLVDWNYGENEPAPLLTYTRHEDTDLAIADLTNMIANGVLTLDPVLEAYIRGRYELPQADPNFQMQPDGLPMGHPLQGKTGAGLGLPNLPNVDGAVKQGQRVNPIMPQLPTGMATTPNKNG